MSVGTSTQRIGSLAGGHRSRRGPSPYRPAHLGVLAVQLLGGTARATLTFRVAPRAPINNPPTVRYVDTGSRDPKQALGTWLSDVLLAEHPVAAIRVQTGFFGSAALGYFDAALQDLAAVDGHTRLLVGSNEGQMPRAAVENLLAVAGPPRAHLGLGVVSFQTGFFHPKVFHFERADGSITAYAGSANLTPSGVRSQHVEAGIILDTKEGDPQDVLASIAKAVDDWFTETRGGFYPVGSAADLDPLVDAGVLGVPSPVRSTRKIKPATGGLQKAQAGHPLLPLVAMPAIKTPLPPKPPPEEEAAKAGTTEPEVPPTQPPAPNANRVAHWSKTLSVSDAQRRAGHQSNLIALTQGDYRGKIDQTTYFRYNLLGTERWSFETTTSKAPIEVANVPIRTVVDGLDQGPLMFRITHATHRESGTNSPTTELHLEPIGPLFAQNDMTGRKAEIEGYDDGSYSLTIS